MAVCEFIMYCSSTKCCDLENEQTFRNGILKSFKKHHTTYKPIWPMFIAIFDYTFKVTFVF